MVLSSGRRPGKDAGDPHAGCVRSQRPGARAQPALAPTCLDFRLARNALGGSLWALRVSVVSAFLGNLTTVTRIKHRVSQRKSLFRQIQLWAFPQGQWGSLPNRSSLSGRITLIPAYIGLAYLLPHHRRENLTWRERSQRLRSSGQEGLEGEAPWLKMNATFLICSKRNWLS